MEEEEEDAEQQHVLREVCGQGGFAYASLVTRAAEGDGGAADAAHDMAWEQLHSGPWHAVHPAWRDAYSLSCLHLAATHLHDARAALRVLDMGLLMGGLLLKARIQSAISERQKRISDDDDDVVVDDDDDDVSHTNIPRDDIAAQMEIPHDDVADHVSHVVTTELPHGSLCTLEVNKRSLLPVEDFLCNFFMPSFPVVITNAMTHWPALKKWSHMGYFMDVIGNRTVPVEVGEHYLASGWKQELMTMLEFLKRIQVSECNCSERPYLAQHPLFEQIPELQEDIRIPDYCAASGGELKVINAWLGPKGTVTPLHYDPHHNLLCQVVGQKYVRLYSPEATKGLYPFEETMLCNSSQVDLDNPDYSKFPLAQNLSFMDCTLEEGEMLYIPPKWWHYVRSLSLSFSVSFWWSGAERDD